VNSDSELIQFFKEFGVHGVGEIVFELEKTPSPPEGSTSRPNEEAEQLDQQGDYQALGWCDTEAEMLDYDGDSRKMMISMLRMLRMVRIVRKRVDRLMRDRICSMIRSQYLRKHLLMGMMT
jgi:hypothetical protein